MSDGISDYVPMHTHAELIRELGGGTTLARVLAELTGESLGRDAVYKWKHKGIAYKWRPFVAKLAVEQEIQLPADLQPYLPPERPKHKADDEPPHSPPKPIRVRKDPAARKNGGGTLRKA